MKQDRPQIILASASPRRRVLLEQIGVRYRRLHVEVEESPRHGEAPERYVLRLALAKACAGWEAQGAHPLPVLAADTAVVLDDEVLGKPRDREDALGMLARLSGRSHRVLSAVALVAPPRQATRLSTSTVTFRPVAQWERRAYLESGEGMDKAGGYAIQGRAAVFVQHLAGSFSGVMGLPLYETSELLADFDIDFWSTAPSAPHV